MSSIWEERGRLSATLRDEAAAVLRPLGMASEAFEYAINNRAFVRTPPLCTFWCEDRAIRDRVNVGIAIHCLGIKLVDDLLDEDTSFSKIDLSAGVFAIQVGTSLLCAAANTGRVHHVLQRHYSNIWKYQLRELRHRPRSFADWLETARVKSGQIFECYTEIACCAANIPFDPAIQGQFASALGTLIMVRDDFKDFEDLTEEHGNIAYLLTLNAVQAIQVERLIDTLHEEAASALAAVLPRPDVQSLIDGMRDDAKRRLAANLP